jgi:hypothetical protein
MPHLYALALNKRKWLPSCYMNLRRGDGRAIGSISESFARMWIYFRNARSGKPDLEQEWRSSTLARPAGHISASPWRHSSKRQPGCTALSTSVARLWEFSSCVYIAGRRPHRLTVTIATTPHPHPGAPFDPTDREPPRRLDTLPLLGPKVHQQECKYVMTLTVPFIALINMATRRTRIRTITRCVRSWYYTWVWNLVSRPKERILIDFT